MRSVVTVALMSLSVLWSQAHAQQRPDFSGTWVAISSGYVDEGVRISQTRATLKLTQTANRRSETITYSMDGTARREPAGPAEERWSTAAWKHETLVLTDTRLTKSVEVRTTRTLSFDSKSRLILGVTRMQLDTNRDPSAPAPATERKTVIVLKKR